MSLEDEVGALAAAAAHAMRAPVLHIMAQTSIAGFLPPPDNDTEQSICLHTLSHAFV